MLDQPVGGGETASLPTFADFKGRKFATPAGLATNNVSQPVAIPLAFVLFKARIHPNVVTLTGLAFSLVGSATLWMGVGLAPLAAVLLYNVGYVFDCADGQVARASRKTSFLGSWLDLSSDAVTWLSLGGALMARMQAQIGLAAAALVGLGFAATKIIQMNAGLVVQRAVGKAALARRHLPLMQVPRFVLDTPITFLILPLGTLVPAACPVLVGLFAAGNLLQAYLNIRRIPAK